MINAENYKSQYNGSGITGPYAYGFPIKNKAYLKAIKTSVIGVDTVLTVDTDYTVSGVSDSNSGNWYITLATALATGERLTITPGLPLLQTTDYENQGSFFAQTHEDSFDYLTLAMQQQQEQIDRCLKISPGSDTPPEDVVLADIAEASATAVVAANTAVAARDEAVNAVANNVVHTYEATSTAAQTYLDVVGFTLAQSTDNIEVFISGVKQAKSSITRTSDTRITFGSSLTAGLKIEVRSASFNSSSADEASAAAAAADASAQAASASAGSAAASAAIIAGKFATGNLVYYVATTGSDSNAGTVGAPFLTIQKALDTLYQYNMNGYTATINVADGTYTGPVKVDGRLVGLPASNDQLQIVGNNCIISTTSADAVSAVNGATIKISGFKFQTTTSGVCVGAYTGSIVSLGQGINFGACAGFAHKYAEGSSTISSDYSYTISGSSSFHETADSVARITYASSIVVTLSGTPAFSGAYACAKNCGVIIYNNGISFSGSATGQRFLIQSGGAIRDYSDNASTFLPGNSAGKIDRGSYNYISAETAFQVSTSGTYAIDASKRNKWVITPTGTLTLTVSNLTDGQDLTVVILTSGTSSYTVTFGSGFLTGTSTLTTGTVTAKNFVLSYWSNGFSAFEKGRTAAL